MTDYAAIATAVKTTFLADAWLGNVANVKTMETHKRGFQVDGREAASFFDVGDLPALAINAIAGPKQSESATTNEIRSTARVSVDAVTRGRDTAGQAGQATHHALIKNIEAVLQKQKSSVNDLGINAYVDDVQTTVDLAIKDGDYQYYLSTTEFNVEVTDTF